MKTFLLKLQLIQFFKAISTISTGNVTQRSRIFLSTIALCVCTFFGQAQVNISSATGGTAISADKAYNSAGAAFTTLGNIQLQETNSADFAITSGTETLILTAPSGWTFSAGT